MCHKWTKFDSFFMRKKLQLTLYLERYLSLFHLPLAHFGRRQMLDAFVLFSTGRKPFIRFMEQWHTVHLNVYLSICIECLKSWTPALMVNRVESRCSRHLLDMANALRWWGFNSHHLSFLSFPFPFPFLVWKAKYTFMACLKC